MLRILITGIVFGLVVAIQSTFAASQFEGVWKVQYKDAGPIEITLSADGSAKHDKGLTGTWKEEDGVAVIMWNDGTVNKIVQEKDGYKRLGYAKGADPAGKPTYSNDAQKVR